MRIDRFGRPIVAACIGIAISSAPALAQSRSPKELISQRLLQWADAFNRRDAPAACDLFAPNLVASVPDAPERGRAAVCSQLKAAMSNKDVRLHYTPDIREIIISGDLAVVRVIWTLRMQRKASVRTTHEHGLDVFRKSTGGKWSITRFIAFSDDRTGI